MVTESKVYKFNGHSNSLKEDNLMDYIDSNNYFSGSVKFGVSSTIIFKCVNAKTMRYIMNDLIKDNKDLKIEIQTHASIAEALQRSDYGSSGL